MPAKLKILGISGFKSHHAPKKVIVLMAFFCISLVMEYYVYILQSEKSGIYYKGQTNNISDRLKNHNSGYVKSTRAYRPWKLVFYTNVETRSGAVKLERKLKNLKSKLRLEEWMRKNNKINNCLDN
jgi:putative endonuclease